MTAKLPRLEGIFTPNIVPLDSRGDINEAEFRRYTDWLIERGVHGLYPNGSTGEFTRFTVEERRRIIAIMADQTRGRVPILAGAAEANVKETLSACEYYHSLGVRAVAIVSPIYYKLSPKSVYAYFREIGRNTPIDVTLYNIPMFASPIDVATVQRLSEECEKIVAIKDSSGDLPNMIRMIKAVRPNRPDFCFLTGWDAALMPMLLIGCDGGTNATSGVVPEITRKLYDLTMARRIDEARELQYKLLTLFDAMLYSADFPEGFRAAVALRGFKTGAGRQPLSGDQQMEIAKLSDTLQCLLAEEGFTDEPVGGCPSGTKIDPQQVNQIVQGVLADLQRRGIAQSFEISGEPHMAKKRPIKKAPARRPVKKNLLAAPKVVKMEKVTEMETETDTSTRRADLSLALLEISNLAPALLVADRCVKTAGVRIVGIESTDGAAQCIKLIGPAANVRLAAEAGEALAKQMGATSFWSTLAGPLEDTVRLASQSPAFSPLLEVYDARVPREDAMKSSDAIGLLETQGLVAALHATDDMLKSASVQLVGKEKIGAAYVTIMIRGDVAAVQAAIAAGKQTVERLGGKLIMADVIPRPHADLAALLPK